jgi:dihydroxy-acid dehydratase
VRQDAARAPDGRGRFNIPTILVICGYQPSGHYNGAHVDIEEVFIGSVQAMFGKLSKETLAGMCDHAITGPGVCAGMGTANSMHIACEALGMTLPAPRPSWPTARRCSSGPASRGGASWRWCGKT